MEREKRKHIFGLKIDTEMVLISGINLFTYIGSMLCVDSLVMVANVSVKEIRN